MLDLEKCLIFPVPNRKVLNKVKCSIGISAKSCAALNHVATVIHSKVAKFSWKVKVKNFKQSAQNSSFRQSKKRGLAKIGRMN